MVTQTIRPLDFLMLQGFQTPGNGFLSLSVVRFYFIIPVLIRTDYAFISISIQVTLS